MQQSDIGANQCHAALRSPMRGSLINKAWKLRTAMAGFAWERVVRSFHSITKLKNFIAGSVKAGLDDGGALERIRVRSKHLTPLPPSWPGFPATSIIFASCPKTRGRRDNPGDNVS